MKPASSVIYSQKLLRLSGSNLSLLSHLGAAFLSESKSKGQQKITHTVTVQLALLKPVEGGLQKTGSISGLSLL